FDSYSAGYGGSGSSFDTALLADVPRGAGVPALVLSGGLTAETVGGQIAALKPFAVDVSSGVESAPGIKDPARIRAFVQAVRAADAAPDGFSCGAPAGWAVGGQGCQSAGCAGQQIHADSAQAIAVRNPQRDQRRESRAYQPGQIGGQCGARVAASRQEVGRGRARRLSVGQAQQDETEQDE